MADTTTILINRRPSPRFDLAGALTRAARETGWSPMRIGMDMIGRMLGQQRLRPDEYFVQGAWTGNRAARSAFVGATSNRRVNLSLIAKGADDQTQLMADKYLAGLVLQANGYPVPEVKAAYAAARMFGPTPTSCSAEELAGWLGEPGHLPAFAKPVNGSMSLGSVPLAAAGPGRVDIGAKVVETAALAREVAWLYPRGWLIQEQLRQPPEIEALIGPGIGTVRVVTLWEAEGPQVLYAVWRHPAPGTWVDAAIFGKPNVGCALDGEGTVTAAQMGDLFSGRALTHSLVNPDLPLVGYRLPHWPEIVELCRSAHRLFPGHALIGWDIAITRRGPVIGEVNSNPLHMSYQRAYRRGFLHPEHRTRLDAARQLLRKRCKGGT